MVICPVYALRTRLQTPSTWSVKCLLSPSTAWTPVPQESSRMASMPTLPTHMTDGRQPVRRRDCNVSNELYNLDGLSDTELHHYLKTVTELFFDLLFKKQKNVMWFSFNYLQRGQHEFLALSYLHRIVQFFYSVIIVTEEQCCLISRSYDIHVFIYLLLI